MKIIKERTQNGPDWIFYCPGCKGHHGIWTSRPVMVDGQPHQWKFDGNQESPTITPSIHIKVKPTKGKEYTTCHSTIKDGKIHFLNDCRHGLRGMTVELPKMEE